MRKLHNVFAGGDIQRPMWISNMHLWRFMWNAMKSLIGQPWSKFLKDHDRTLAQYSHHELSRVIYNLLWQFKTVTSATAFEPIGRSRCYALQIQALHASRKSMRCCNILFCELYTLLPVVCNDWSTTVSSMLDMILKVSHEASDLCSNSIAEAENDIPIFIKGRNVHSPRGLGWSCHGLRSKCKIARRDDISSRDQGRGLGTRWPLKLYLFCIWSRAEDQGEATRFRSRTRRKRKCPWEVRRKRSKQSLS